MKASSLIACFSTLLLISTYQAGALNRFISTPSLVIANTSTPDNIRSLAQSITVKVLVKDTAGSGFIIAKEDNLYTVITNAHVVDRGEPYKIQTSDGKVYDAILMAKEDSKTGSDLAKLQFSSTITYAVAQLSDRSLLAENQAVYVAGYPYDSQNLAFSEGKITLITEKPLKGGYQIGYTNETQQGMSGGALLNAEGKVIGIIGMGSQAILDEAYTYIDGTRPDAQTLDKLRESSFAVPSDRLTESVATETQPYTGIVAEVDNIAQKITVRIDSRTSGNGSGAIIGKNGQTYYVLTASHVIQNRDEYQIVTPDGKSHPLQTNKIFEGIDLALVEFQSPNNYTVATLANYDLTAGLGGNNRAVFLSGFPSVKAGTPNRILTYGGAYRKESTAVVTRDLYSLSEGREIVYTNLSRPGMSGGALLDRLGRVVAINTGAEDEIEINEAGEIVELHLGKSLGVSIGTFLSLLSTIEIDPNILKVETTSPPKIPESDLSAIHQQFLNFEVPAQNASAFDWLNYANLLWRANQNEDAIAAVNRAISIKPDFYLAYYQKGLILPNQDPQTLASFEKVTQLQPNFYQGWRWLAITLEALNKYPEALVAVDKALALEPKDFNLYRERGDILGALKRYQDAIATYHQGINFNPHPSLYNYRGLVYLELREDSKAIADFNKVIELIPDYAAAYNNRGSIYKRQGDFQQALADYNKAIEFEPELNSAYGNRGSVYSLLGDYEKALDDSNKAIELQPDDFFAYNVRGDIYSKLKNFSQALSDYTKAIELNPNDASVYIDRGSLYQNLQDYPKAIADFNKAIEIDPNSYNAYTFRASIYTNLKDYQKAYEDATKAIELAPENTSEKANSYWNRAIISYYSGNQEQGDRDLQKTIETFTQVIKLYPKYYFAYFSRGSIYSFQKNYQKAIEDYTSAIAIAPQQAFLYRQRAGAYFDIKDYPKAIEDINKAIEIEPDNVQYYQFRAGIYFQSSNYSQAIDEFTKVIELEPNNAVNYASRGDVYVQLEDYPKALEDYTKAIKLNPKYTLVYAARGTIYHRQGNYDAALKDYNQAISLDEKLFVAVNNIGVIMYEMGDIEGAIAQWQKAIEINDQSFYPQFNLGVALYTKGEQEKGLALVEAAFKLDSRYTDITFLKKSLWDKKFREDTEKLLANPRIRELLSHKS